jgi:hypothetical protein
MDFRRCAQFRRHALYGVSMLALAASAAASAQAQTTLGPLVKVAGGSIFAHCTADNVAGQPGTNFPGTTVEPNLAINPANTSNLLVGVQQDRWNNGGSRGLRSNVSKNGGASFTPSSTPGVTQCQGGPWPRSSDPWVAFSTTGVAYESALVVQESRNPTVLAAASGQTVSRSTDGGVTWGPPITLIADFDPNTLDDKNSVTADASNPNFAYVVWDRLTQFPGGHGVADEGGGSGNAAAPVGSGMDGTDIAHVLLNHARSVAAGTATANSKTFVIGPTYFSRTTNAGTNWSLPAIIWDPGSNSQTIGNQVVAEGGVALRNYFVEIQDNTAGQPSRIGSVRSTDRGATWSTPDYAQSVVNTGATTPNLGQPIRSADILFSVAADRTNAITYLVWEDSRFSGVNETAFAFSPDNGFSWTAPVRINQTPRTPTNPLFQQALIPTVGVAADGTVVVTYFDFRRATPGQTFDNTDVWAVQCNTLASHDFCLSNGDWTAHEKRLTNTSFNFDLAPLTTSGRFVGDYMSLKSLGQTMYAVFGAATGPNLTSTFLRTINLPAAVAVK